MLWRFYFLDLQFEASPHSSWAALLFPVWLLISQIACLNLNWKGRVWSALSIGVKISWRQLAENWTTVFVTYRLCHYLPQKFVSKIIWYFSNFVAFSEYPNFKKTEVVKMWSDWLKFNSSHFGYQKFDKNKKFYLQMIVW